MQLKLEKEWEPTGLGPQPQGSSQLFSKRKTFILKENGSLFPVSVAIFSFIRARRGLLSVVKSDTSTQIMGDCYQPMHLGFLVGQYSLLIFL